MVDDADLSLFAQWYDDQTGDKPTRDAVRVAYHGDIPEHATLTYIGDESRMTRYLGRMRWYDARLGRWLTRDPAGYVDGLNVYLFVGGNPLMFVDPTGLSKHDDAEDVHDVRTFRTQEQWDAFHADLSHDGRVVYRVQLGPPDNEARGDRRDRHYTYVVRTQRSDGNYDVKNYTWKQWNDEGVGDSVTHANNRMVAAGSAQIAEEYKAAYGFSFAFNFIGLRGVGSAGSAAGKAAPGATRAAVSAHAGVAADLLAAAKSGTMNVADIRFSQYSVNRVFHNGTPVADEIARLKSGGKPMWPKIRVYHKDGKIFSLDNRRLLAAKEAGLRELEVQYVEATDPRVAKEIDEKHNPIDGEGLIVGMVGSDAQRRETKENLRKAGRIQ